MCSQRAKSVGKGFQRMKPFVLVLMYGRSNTSYVIKLITQDVYGQD